MEGNGIACRTPSRQRVWQREQTGAVASPGIRRRVCEYTRTRPPDKNAISRVGVYVCVPPPRNAGRCVGETTQPNISATRSRCRKIIRRPAISRRISPLAARRSASSSLVSSWSGAGRELVAPKFSIFLTPRNARAAAVPCRSPFLFFLLLEVFFNRMKRTE